MTMANNKSTDDRRADSNRRQMMLEMPLNKLIPLMALPTVVSMLVTALYSATDVLFVSSLGTEATAAVGVGAALESVVLMAGSFLAVGAASFISRLLGAGDNTKAAHTLAASFYSALALGGVMTGLGFLFLEPMLILFGATEAVLPLGKDYAHYVLIAAPFMAANFVLNHTLRSEGSVGYAMAGLVIGAVIGAGLDALFIFGFGWGVRGASAATAISKLISFVVLLWPYLRKKSVLSLHPRNIRVTGEIASEVFKMGCPALLRLAATTASAVVTNRIAGGFSDAALAAVTVAGRIVGILQSAMLGFGQGFQPVAGFAWGARQYDRIRAGFKFTSIAAVAAMLILGGVMYVYSPWLVALFNWEGGDEVARIGTLALRLQLIAMPVVGWVIVVNMLFAGIGKAFGAIVLSMARQGYLLIPLLYALSAVWGVDGLAAAQAAADALSLFIALPLAVHALRRLRPDDTSRPA